MLSEKKAIQDVYSRRKGPTHATLADAELECADLPFQTAIVTDGCVVHKFRIQYTHGIFDESFFNGHRGSATVPIAAMCQYE